MKKNEVPAWRRSAQTHDVPKNKFFDSVGDSHQTGRDKDRKSESSNGEKSGLIRDGVVRNWIATVDDEMNHDATGLTTDEVNKKKKERKKERKDQTQKQDQAL